MSPCVTSSLFMCYLHNLNMLVSMCYSSLFMCFLNDFNVLPPQSPCVTTTVSYVISKGSTCKLLSLHICYPVFILFKCYLQTSLHCLQSLCVTFSFHVLPLEFPCVTFLVNVLTTQFPYVTTTVSTC